MIPFEGHGRPNDQRGFIHKKILGLGSKLVGGLVGSVATTLIPGAGIIQGGVRLARRLGSGGGGLQLPELQEASVIGIPVGASADMRLPESGPMQQNRMVGIAPQDVARAAFQGNGACPAPVRGGNRRINARGEQACPGFHWNQSTYTRLGGPCSTKPAGTVLKGTEQVKNRRKFNTANGPARKRAIDRLKAGEGDAKDALRAMGYRTISKRSAREMRLPARRGRHR